MLETLAYIGMAIFAVSILIQLGLLAFALIASAVLSITEKFREKSDRPLTEQPDLRLPSAAKEYLDHVNQQSVYRRL